VVKVLKILHVEPMNLVELFCIRVRHLQALGAGADHVLLFKTDALDLVDGRDELALLVYHLFGVVDGAASSRPLS